MKTHKKFKRIYLGVIATIGLVGVMSLQLIWLSNTYMLIKNEFQKDCNAILATCIEQEAFIRFEKAPLDTEIKGGSVYDSIPSITYLLEGLANIGLPLSVEQLDSLVSIKLEQKGFPTQSTLRIIDCKTNKTIQEYGLKKRHWSDIQAKPIPLKSDCSQAILLIVQNPYSAYFQRTPTLLVATLLLMAIVIICIVKQISTITRMKQLSQVREDFTFAMIHDMKTPLSTIIMTLNSLRKGILDSKPELKEKYYHIAESEAEHLLQLANKALTISKIESHKLHMNKTWIEIQPIVESLTENYIANTCKPFHLSFDLKANTVYADNEYLAEVISNLIDNSIKYSKDSVDILIRSEALEGFTRISVLDNGLGISKKDQAIIFNKYERGAAIHRNKEGGATGFGLGLNFVKQVVDAHDGKITVRSKEGEYTEFVILLPNR